MGLRIVEAVGPMAASMRKERHIVNDMIIVLL